MSLSNKRLVEYGDRLLKEKTKQTIADLGIKDPERLMKYVNFDGLQFSDDMDILGLTDQIESIKNDLPELFDAKLRVGGQADAAATTVVNTMQSASQLQAKFLLGR